MKSKLRIPLMLALSAVLLYSVGRIVLTQIEYRTADAIYEESRAIGLQVVPSAPPSSPPAPAPAPAAPSQVPATEEAPADDGFPAVSADLAALAAINDEVIGWLWNPDTDISYPLLQGQDNQKYLNTSYNRKHSSAGSIFEDFRNAGDMTDDNTLIYGHNMKNGAMFGTLKEFAQPEYRNEHKYVYLFLDGIVLKYRIFAAYKTESTSDSYTRDFSKTMSYEDFLGYITASAGDETVQLPQERARLLTLSTCTSGRRTERFVLHAVLEAEKVLDTSALTPVPSG